MYQKTLLLTLGFVVCFSNGIGLAQSGLEVIEPIQDQLTQPTPNSTEILPSPAIPSFRSRNMHRIKDITYPQGDHGNEVTGLGLVSGLAGTGGRNEQTEIMARNFFLLTEKIAVVKPGTRSFSAVIVQADIPAYASIGQKIHVTIATADDATSLRGGQLARTFLRGVDGLVYAVASGPIIGGGVSAGGVAASIQRDHPTGGACEARIVREICCDRALSNGRIKLILFNKDYSTSVSISNEINQVFAHAARAIDPGTVEIQIPRFYHSKIPDFISVIGQLWVHVDQRARVVVNQKTGTIVMGQNVRISPVVFGIENLFISTAETPVASQPAPLSDGRTVVLPRSSVDVLETGGNYNSLGGGTTVGDLGKALNTLGVSPNLMITVLNSLRNQGALQAELIIE